MSQLWRDKALGSGVYHSRSSGGGAGSGSRYHRGNRYRSSGQSDRYGGIDRYRSGGGEGHGSSRSYVT